MKKVRNYSKRALSLSLAAMSAMSPNLMSLTANAEEANSSTNASGGDTLVQMHVQNDYTVQVPAGIVLTYNENGQERPLYDADYDILFKGHGNGKTLAVETDDVNMEGDAGRHFVTNYLGDKEDASHIAIGTKDFSEEGEIIKGYASMGADNVKMGNYDGTAEFRYFMVDTGTKVSDLKNFFNLDESKLAMGAKATHQLNATDKDGNNINDKVEFSSSDESVATVTDNGLIMTSANAAPGSEVTITASLAGDDTKDSASLMNELSKLGAMTVEAAEDGTFIASVTVTIVDIDFMDDEDGIESVEIFPGENKSVRALLKPNTSGVVSWSATKATGVALQKNGNDCTINLANDMAEGTTFKVIATYGDYSKELLVTAKSRHTHVPGEAVRENSKPSTCEDAGSYDSVVYCEDCGDELVRTHVAVNPKGHTAGTPVRENEVDATCETAGSYDEVVYCVDCDEEISREHKTIAATGHKWSQWTDENGVQVRYCENDHGHKETGEATKYKITYNLDGGEISGQKTTYTKDDSFTLPTPTKDGYEFVGWTGSNGSTAQINVSLSKGSTGDKTFTAQWKEAGLVIKGSKISEETFRGITVTKYDTENGLTAVLSGTQTSDFSQNEIQPWSDCKVVIADNLTLTNASYMFYYCKNTESIDLKNADTSNVTNMRCMFALCNNLTSLDVSNFDTSKVTDISGMFTNCSNLTSLDVSNFDTSKVMTMSGMFQGCSNLTNLDVSKFDTSKVTNMWNMFQDCNTLTSLDVNNFDTSNVMTMSGMFHGCKNLASLDVSNFDTRNVTNMNHMFGGCSSLTSLDVSNFDTSKVTNMADMFWACNNLTSLDVSNFDTSKVTDMSYMYCGCKNLTSLDVSNFDTSKVTNIGNMFYSCNNLTSLKTFKVIGSKYADLPSGTWKGSDGQTYTKITKARITLTKQ